MSKKLESFIKANKAMSETVPTLKQKGFGKRKEIDL